MSVFFVAIPGELLAQGSMQLPGAETAQPNEVRAVTLDVTYYGSRSIQYNGFPTNTENLPTAAGSLNQARRIARSEGLELLNQAIANKEESWRGRRGSNPRPPT
jgi:hypothetical protein